MVVAVDDVEPPVDENREAAAEDEELATPPNAAVDQTAVAKAEPKAAEEQKEKRAVEDEGTVTNDTEEEEESESRQQKQSSNSSWRARAYHGLWTSRVRQPILWTLQTAKRNGQCKVKQKTNVRPAGGGGFGQVVLPLIRHEKQPTGQFTGCRSAHTR